MSFVYLSYVLCLSSSLTFCERSFGRLYVFGAVFSTIRIQAYSWLISCFLRGLRGRPMKKHTSCFCV